jgi:hypothetical protein
MGKIQKVTKSDMPERAERVAKLRGRLRFSQAEFGHQLRYSAMAISRGGSR